MSILALLRRTAAQAKYVLVASLLLLCAFQLIVVGQASAIAEQNAFGRMAELVPAFLQRGLGSKAMLLATFKGTIAFGYFHPVVLVLIATLGVYLATEPAHEVEAGLVDLELARSVPRHRLITRSLLASAGAIGGGVLLMGLGTWAGLRLFAAPSYGSPSGATLAVLLVHVAAVAAVFGALGLAIAAGARRWSTAFFTATLATVVLYLLDFLSIGWPMMRTLAWVSPFRYFPALSIVAGDPTEWRNLLVLLSVAVALTAAAYWRFERRDL